MLDPPKPAKLSLPVAVAFLLALCVALIVIAACGSPTADAPPAISPSPPDLRPTPTPAKPIPTPARPTLTPARPTATPARPTPTPATRATAPVLEEAALLGLWADDQDLVLELSGSGVYTQSRGSRQPEIGTWWRQEDGSLKLEGQSGVVVPHGNLLLLEWVGKPGPGGTVGILHKVGADGNLLAYEPSSPIEVPPIEPADIMTITVLDSWTGLSPLAPIEALFRLQPIPGSFSGTADFQVAGYTDPISRSVPISVPLEVIEDLLALLESTPLEEGEYKPLFSHTDDFPAIIIAVEGGTGALEFSTKSQGSRYIPWRVVVGQDQYVTYADIPAQAIDLLDPYLAREAQQALFDLALSRDP